MIQSCGVGFFRRPGLDLNKLCRGDVMLNLFADFEPRLLLHAGVLAFGLATFFGLILLSRCPRCNWLEWIGERSNTDDPE
jgi:hypothetical protein